MSGDPAARARSLRGGDRAQTVLDFAVGMSVFLAVVGFTFAFVPSLLEPYAVGEGATVIAAERGAAQLAESSLVGSGPTSTLSAACTLAFFDGTGSETASEEWDCAWTSNADDVHAEIGIDEFRGVNLTVSRNGTVAALGEDDVALRAGPSPPRSESVSAASRIVALDADGDGDRETHRLTLRVW